MIKFIYEQLRNISGLFVCTMIPSLDQIPLGDPEAIQRIESIEFKRITKAIGMRIHRNAFQSKVSICRQTESPGKG